MIAVEVDRKSQPSRPKPRYRSFSFVLRSSLTILIVIAGWYLITAFRTLHFGETPGSFAFYFVGGALVFFPMLLLASGTGEGKPEQVALIVMMATIIGASVWANGEEKIVTQVMPDVCAERVCLMDEDGSFVYNRAAPFSYNSFRYHPEDGWID